ncbi:hypothetical protein COCSADRAFT_213728 [Bipolaris sorokiniana ND90Pr]|uniref:Uncharacterized protein n=1 Tax=Cochliobolus sativus (strain ND90Pr / ATCC 201652) TaxID=665912 RepID=M2TKU9_COCSN|nr:uncharacterized protein COCSADRAFT_213728 [Bipolaris sorokiniana ND90Pr]EMD69771.1 hypothetical protein COCSADRAFT_213728 [Bipolaris sorokiniana ND90Pr]
MHKIIVLFNSEEYPGIQVGALCICCYYCCFPFPYLTFYPCFSTLRAFSYLTR